MSRIAKAVLALSLAWPALGAADKPKEEPAAPAEQYQVLVKEYNDAMKGFLEVYRAAKTNEERGKLIQEKYPGFKYAPRFLELAEKNPKDPVALDALEWVVINTRVPGGGKNDSRARAQTLLCDYAASDKVGTVCQIMARGSADKESEKFLRAVLEKNPKRDIQAQACLALAGCLKERVDQHRQLVDDPESAKELESSLGKGAVEELRKEDPTKTSREIEALYERVTKDYSDVKAPRGSSLGEQAKKELYEIRFLAVGKPAPDIEGEDADGKKFKLSDYRGKVVLLDFWGNW
jgi:hypothetical protein